jgi:hypothetical protein
MSEHEQYGPTPTSQGIRGYRDLTDVEVDWVNANKMMEETLATHFHQVAGQPGVDPRWVAIARTHFQEGFSALTRAITRPVDPFERGPGQ